MTAQKTAKKTTSKKTSSKKTPTRKAAAKKAPSKKAPSKKASGKKKTASSAPSKKTAAKKTPAKKKASAKKTTAKKTPVKKKASAKRTTAKKTATRKTVAKKKPMSSHSIEAVPEWVEARPVAVHSITLNQISESTKVPTLRSTDCRDVPGGIGKLVAQVRGLFSFLGRTSLKSNENMVRRCRYLSRSFQPKTM